MLVKSFDIEYMLKSLIKRYDIPAAYNAISTVKLIQDVSEDIDSLVQNSFSISPLTSTIVKLIQECNAEIDSLIERLGIDISHDADMLLETTFTSDLDIDMLLLATEDIELDSATTIKLIQECSAAVDHLLERLGICIDYISHAYFIKALSQEYESNMLSIKALDHDIDADTFIERYDIDVTHQADSLLEKGFDAAHDIDMLLQIAWDISRVLSTSVKVILDAIYDLGAYVEIRDVPREYTSAGTIKIIVDIDYELDTLLEKMFEAWHQMETTIKRIQEVDADIDMYLLRLDIDTPYPSDAVVQRAFESGFSPAATLKLIQDIYSSLCTTIKLIQESAFGVDVLMEKMLEAHSEHDMLLRRDSIDVSVDIDQYLQKAQSAMYIGNMLLEKGFVQSLVSDALFDKTLNTEYAASYVSVYLGFFETLLHDLVISRCTDVGYFSRVRVRKPPVCVNGRSRIPMVSSVSSLRTTLDIHLRWPSCRSLLYK
ncbi:MAG TPA: hypothetical protein PLW12_09290 [Methanothrix sp.]|nr:hypothetical protein [Methanothrix sp.]